MKVTFDAASSSALKFSVRRWGFSNSLVHNNSHFERNRERKKERGGGVMHPLRAATHPVRFARTQTHFERTFGEIILDGGGIKALRRKMDSLAGEKDERATTIRRSRRVAVDWGQTLASTCTHARCSSRAADTRVPGRVRVRGRTGSVRARRMADAPAQLLSRCNARIFWTSRPFRSVLREMPGNFAPLNFREKCMHLALQLRILLAFRIFGAKGKNTRASYLTNVVI